MKRLTITVLTLLILGGCSQEPTELERCIEANTPSLEYNYSQKMVQFEEENKGLYEEDFHKYYKNLIDFEDNIVTDFEHEVNSCRQDMMTKYRDEHGDSKLSTESEIKEYSERYWAYTNNCKESLSAELIEKATKVCHAQGIY